MAPTYKDLVLQLACRCAWSTNVRMCMQEGIVATCRCGRGYKPWSLYITLNIDIVQKFAFFFYQKVQNSRAFFALQFSPIILFWKNIKFKYEWKIHANCLHLSHYIFCIINILLLKLFYFIATCIKIYKFCVKYIKYISPWKRYKL